MDTIDGNQSITRSDVFHCCAHSSHEARDIAKVENGNVSCGNCYGRPDIKDGALNAQEMKAHRMRSVIDII